jgi:hypothetical protein
VNYAKFRSRSHDKNPTDPASDRNAQTQGRFPKSSEKVWAERKWESMKDQHSASIAITFLLLLPWLGRAAVSAIAVWRGQTDFPNQRRNCA